MFGLGGGSLLGFLLFIAIVIFLIVRIIRWIFGIGKSAKERKRQTELLEKINKKLDNE
jgi:large-conductance mechanosensitive channel